MSSNESVERMLKQLENLLRQQDRDQTRETEAELEPVAAGGGSPGGSDATTFTGTTSEELLAYPSTTRAELEFSLRARHFTRILFYRKIPR